MVRMSNAYTAASLMIQSRNNCIFGQFAVSSGHTKKCAFSDGMTRSKGEMVLNLMNEHLSVRPFFVGDDYTSRILRFTPIPMSRMKAGTTFRIDRR